MYSLERDGNEDKNFFCGNFEAYTWQRGANIFGCQFDGDYKLN